MKKKNKITLRRKETYEAFAGDTLLGTFNLESEWKGMAMLKSVDAELIINRAIPANQALSALFGVEEDVEVVKASPDLIAAILKYNTPTLDK